MWPAEYFCLCMRQRQKLGIPQPLREKYAVLSRFIPPAMLLSSKAFLKIAAINAACADALAFNQIALLVYARRQRPPGALGGVAPFRRLVSKMWRSLLIVRTSKRACLSGWWKCTYNRIEATTCEVGVVGLETCWHQTNVPEWTI